MNKRQIAMGVAGALLLPVLLAFAAYFVSARSFATTTQAVSAPHSKIGRPQRSPSPSPRESAGGDVSGNCDEAEHQNDAACASPSPSGTKDDAGGSGSGKSGSDDSGSGKSGSDGSSGSDDSVSGSSGGSGSNDSGSGGSGDSGSSGGSGDSGSGGSGSSGGDD
jgi:hypothetical protein